MRSSNHEAPENQDDNSLFDALIAFAVDGIMVIDERGIVRVFNDACERLFGYSAAEVIGRNVKMLMPEPYHSEHDGYLAHYVSTGEKHIIGIGREVFGKRKDGSTFPMNLSVGEGKVRGDHIFLGIITDISERVSRDRRIQELQTEMLHVGRLTDMGQVSANIAHELNQPLTAILNYANAGLDIAVEKNEPELRSIFGKLAEQATRAGNIIRRLRAFVEKREPNRTVEDIVRIVDEAIRLGQLNALEREIKLRVSVEHGVPEVLVDRVQIQQVLINLMKNAVEAMESSPVRNLTITIVHLPPSVVRVSVADTGPGLSENMTSKLFQPFVSTKTKGMGMGLNICRGIIESHGGRLWFDENTAGGAVFHFSIPVAPGTDA